MSDLSSFFKSRPYIRVFVKMADAPAFVRSYLENFDAKLEYVFSIPRLNNLQVVAIDSPHGNISAVVTDSFAGFPEYLARTKILYWTDNIDAALETAGGQYEGLAGQDACADRLSGTFRDPWRIRNRTG